METQPALANTATTPLPTSSYPSFEPGGETVAPTALPGPPRLHVRFKSRYSLYVSSEATGEFVVDAALSQYFGTAAWPNASRDGTPADRLVFSITEAVSGAVLVESSVAVNGSAKSVFAFPLTALRPRLEPYDVVLYGAPVDGTPTFMAAAQLAFLPDKAPGNGSVTRVDNLHLGLWHKSSRTGDVFKPFLPYGYYSEGYWMTSNTSVADVQKYADLGFNAATTLAQWDTAKETFAYLEKIDLRFMYNFRDYYQNLTELTNRIPWVKDSEALFAWWSADEYVSVFDCDTRPCQAFSVLVHRDPLVSTSS